MSKETSTGVRSNFASRLLSKAMSDRKTTGENKKITPADASKFATVAAEVESKEPVLASSSVKE